MFHESRSQEEVARNCAIKDAMRETSVARDLLAYLSSTALRSADNCDTESRNYRLGYQSLLCVSELVGWLDLNLVISSALPALFHLLHCPSAHYSLKGAVFLCLYELVKKGMDPIAKVQMVSAVDLLAHLTPHFPPPVSSSYLYQSFSSPERDSTCDERLGLLINMLTIELLGCWSKYEEMITSQGEMDRSIEEVESMNSLIAISPVVSSMLAVCLPVLLTLFEHTNSPVSITTHPACNKLISILKQQQQQYKHINSSVHFIAGNYLDTLLLSIYHQMHFPLDFDFDNIEDLDDDNIQDVLKVGDTLYLLLLFIIMRTLRLDYIVLSSSLSSFAFIKTMFHFYLTYDVNPY
jgi:hypothetical protein